jgi:multisubunit Na+/H+ antiporter MnhC subunit
MSTYNVLLLILALLGFMPLIIILYKRNRVKKILTTGLVAKAVVYDVRPIPRTASESVLYWFHAQNSAQQYTGNLMIKAGLYKNGDTLDVYYLQGNPQRNTVNGAWGSPVIVGFGIALAAFALFAAYKLYQMGPEAIM